MADKKVILVVDDDPGIRKILREVLQSLGYICQSAADGFEALAYQESTIRYSPLRYSYAGDRRPRGNGRGAENKG